MWKCTLCSLMLCDSCIRTVGPHSALSLIPSLCAHPQALIFVRVCDSPEISTHPSNAKRVDGDQVSLCHKKRRRYWKVSTYGIWCSIFKARYISWNETSRKWRKLWQMLFSEAQLKVLNQWKVLLGSEELRGCQWLIQPGEERHDMLKVAQTDHKCLNLFLDETGLQIADMYPFLDI